jgi:hypothetical protein
MKIIKYSLIIAFTVFYINSFGQTDGSHTTPQEHDNLILIVLADTFDIAFDNFSKSIKLFGFTIESINPQTNIFTTSWHYPFKDEKFRMKIIGVFVQIINNEYIKTMIYVMGIVEQTKKKHGVEPLKSFYCEYEENGTHLKNSGFSMMKLTAEYNGGTIRYSYGEIP